jgi:hypothetical protein
VTPREKADVDFQIYQNEIHGIFAIEMLTIACCFEYFPHLCDPKLHYLIHRGPAMSPVLSQMKTVAILKLYIHIYRHIYIYMYFFKTHFNINPLIIQIQKCKRPERHDALVTKFVRRPLILLDPQYGTCFIATF